MDAPIISLTDELIALARSFVGTKEEGSNRGKLVEMFQREINPHPCGEAWCYDFSYYCVDQICDRHQIPNRLVRTELCLAAWNRAPSDMKVSEPAPGCLVIWQHGETSQGHAGIVVAIEPDGSLRTVEGNTNDGTGVTREGDGVYERVRDRHGDPAMHVLGFIKAF